MSGKVLVAPTTSEVEEDILELKTNWDGRPYSPAFSYFWFEDDEQFCVDHERTDKPSGYIAQTWDGTIEYFANNDWIEWSGETIDSSFIEGKYVVALRGIGNTKISNPSSMYSHFVFREHDRYHVSTRNIRCCGNIENLLDYETVAAGGHPQMADYCFERLFQGCYVDVANLVLGAETLSWYCYKHMFSSGNVTGEVALPVETMTKGCYSYMFCQASLSDVPSLPATTLATDCYAYMFDGSNISSAPVLSATTLADGCYRHMFSRCSSLTTPPDLPASQLWEECYKEMFMGSGLTTPPRWNTNYYIYLGVSSCEAMFKNCTHLTRGTMPFMGTGGPAKRCCYEMYAGCTSLNGMVGNTYDHKYIYQEESFAYMFKDCIGMTYGGFIAIADTKSVPAKGCFKGMYQGCTSYKRAYTSSSGGSQHCISDVNAESCCESMYEGCTSLEYGPSFLGATGFGDKCCKRMFYGCTSLTQSYVPSKWSDPVQAGDYCFSEMYCGCTKLIFARAMVFSALGEGSLYRMYAACTSLETAPAIADTYQLVSSPSLGDKCCEGMFAGCTKLISPPELSAATLAASCYKQMFEGCVKLEHVPFLPATTLADLCYSRMFAGCTKLADIPVLPATDLQDDSYVEMFDGCSLIKLSEIQTGEYVNAYRIPSSGTGTGSGEMSDMFKSTGGTFTGTPQLNTTYYTSNTVV